MSVDVLQNVWATKAWGDGSSAADETNVICPDCEVVIAPNLPIAVAIHIAGLHNASLNTLATQPAREAQEPVAWRAVAHPETGMGAMVNQIKHRLTEDADSLYGKENWTLDELVPRHTLPDATATIERLRRQNDRLREKAQAVLANPGNDYARNALRAALTTEEG